MRQSSVVIDSKLPQVGTTIFTVMSKLAADCGAINLSQGFPDFQADSSLFDATARAMREGRNQYPPMAGVPELRSAIADKVAALYGASYDADSEITVTAGATQAIFTAIAAFVRAGDASTKVKQRIRLQVNGRNPEARHSPRRPTSG